MTSTTRSLTGRRALVTGGGKGIGQAISSALAAEGADLVITGRSNGELSPVAAQLTAEHGVRVSVVSADLADASALAPLAQEAWAAYGALDILVNNAGMSIPQLATDVDAASFDLVLGVNLRAPALLGADIGGRMAAAGGGRIINVASVAGKLALTEHYTYCMSKAALIMAGKVLALELGDRGVRVNTVCPTIVLTEMGLRVWSDPVKAAPMMARIPGGHFATPQDVAAAIVFLAGPGAEMINGTEIMIDGGFSAT